MASLTHSSFISHPWFNQPSMKRKQSSSPELSSDDSRNIDLSKPPSENRAKRRRVSTLERGFSHLTLDRAHQPISSIAESSNVGGFPPSTVPADDAMDIEPTSIPPPFIPPDLNQLPSSSSLHIRPSSIEEPDSPPLRDLKMKGTSWYEPEPDRIIVTDLDSSDDEDSPETDQPIQVSPALLERIRQRELLHQSLSVPPSSTALVLYRPLTIPQSDSTEPDVAEVLEAEPLPVVEQDDQMDIETI